MASFGSRLNFCLHSAKPFGRAWWEFEIIPYELAQFIDPPRDRCCCTDTIRIKSII